MCSESACQQEELYRLMRPFGGRRDCCSKCPLDGRCPINVRRIMAIANMQVQVKQTKARSLHFASQSLFLS
jgi:hypothetical protein